MITDKLKAYFKKKALHTDTPSAPEGVCPNCWGKQEWEGEFYTMVKAKNLSPETDPYNNFIKEFVTKHIQGILLKEDTYTCTTCQMSYKPDGLLLYHTVQHAKSARNRATEGNK